MLQCVPFVSCAGDPGRNVQSAYRELLLDPRRRALIGSNGTMESELIDLVFRDLAAVHGVTVEWLQQFYTPGECFAWDWLHDPLTMGSSCFASGRSDS